MLKTSIVMVLAVDKQWTPEYRQIVQEETQEPNTILIYNEPLPQAYAHTISDINAWDTIAHKFLAANTYVITSELQKNINEVSKMQLPGALLAFVTMAILHPDKLILTVEDIIERRKHMQNVATMERQQTGATVQ